LLHMGWKVALLQLLQILAFVSCTRFWVLYVWRYPSWRRSPEGRYLVISKVAFSVILGLAVLSVVWPQFLRWAGRDFLRLAVFAALVAVFVWLNGIADMAWRRGRAQREQDQEVRQ
jgi:uncharacterized membrane protein YfbV (UPF0208 family)